jgi:uncharacterized protein (TIGR00251 family)
MLDLRDVPGGVRLKIRVQPRATRTTLAGAHGDALKVWLAAPPVDGKANDALIAFLAETLDVPRRSVRIVAGAASRDKTVEVEGITAAAVRSALAL